MEMLNEMMKAPGEPGEEEGMEWGTGLVQKKAKLDRKAELEKQRNAPFARYEDDVERDREKRQVDRWGDPMLEYLEKQV